MTTAVRYPELAEGLSAVRAIVETLDRSVRGASGALPAEVVARWGDFHARWRAVTAAFDTVDRGPADRAQAHAWLSELASNAARWTDALGRWGVPVEAVQVGFDGFISPSRARARMDSVNAEVATLNEHIALRRAQLGEPFVHAWSRWRDTWRSFYGGYPPTWDWWYLGNASAWNETLVYQERLGDWRQAAERAGVRFTVPAPQSAPERRDGGDWLGSARDIAIAGAVGAAVLGAVYLVSRVA